MKFYKNNHEILGVAINFDQTLPLGGSFEVGFKPLDFSLFLFFLVFSFEIELFYHKKIVSLCSNTK